MEGCHADGRSTLKGRLTQNRYEDWDSVLTTRHSFSNIYNLIEAGGPLEEKASLAWHGRWLAGQSGI